MKTKILINRQFWFLTVFACIVLVQSCEQPAGSTTVVPSSCVDNKPNKTDYTKQLNAVNHFIAFDSAKFLADNFMRNRQTILSGKFANDSMILPISETFNLKAIDSLICQSGAVGFRIYPVLDANNKVRFVLVGVDENGKDTLQLAAANRRTGALLKPGGTMAKAGGTGGETNNGLLLEAGQRYP